MIQKDETGVYTVLLPLYDTEIQFVIKGKGTI